MLVGLESIILQEYQSDANLVLAFCKKWKRNRRANAVRGSQPPGSWLFGDQDQVRRFRLIRAAFEIAPGFDQLESGSVQFPLVNLQRVEVVLGLQRQPLNAAIREQVVIMPTQDEFLV